MLMHDETAKPSDSQKAVRQKLDTSGDGAQIKAYKENAERLFQMACPMWEKSDNAWRNGWAMDTFLDYFTACDVDASSYAEIFLGVVNPTNKTLGWWDDFGWIGIASLRAAELNISPSHRDDLLKVAINSWAYTYGPGWSKNKTNPAIFPFTDVPGWKKFEANHKNNVGAPNVWTKIEQTWSSITEDQKMQRKPRYSPGGAWNSTIEGAEQPLLSPSYDGTGHYLNPIQNSVTNGLYAILTLRIYLASQNPLFQDVFSQSTLDADACLQAWKDQIGWLNQWLIEMTDADESLLLKLEGSEVLVRERVSTFHDWDGQRYWDAAYVKELAWTGDQGLLIGALREGQAAGYLHPEPEVLGLYPDIIEGVFKNGYYPRTYGTVDGSFLLPWMVIGSGDPYTATAPGGSNDGIDIDDSDYQTGNAIFMRYLLQAYKTNPTLVEKYKDYILSSANNLIKEGFGEQGSPYGSCDAYAVFSANILSGDPMTPYVNGLSVLLLAIEMSYRIDAEVSFQGVDVTFNGTPLPSEGYTPVEWTIGHTPCLYSYVAYVINRHSGEVAATYAHSGPSGRTFHDQGERDPGTTTVPPELRPFAHDKNYILIFLWASVIDEYGDPGTDSNLLAPSGPLLDFLVLCGAGSGWHSWIHTDHYDIQGPGPYALVGICGSGTGAGFEKRIDVSINPSPLREVPENPSVSFTVPLQYTDEGWTPRL